MAGTNVRPNDLFSVEVTRPALTDYLQGKFSDFKVPGSIPSLEPTKFNRFKPLALRRALREQAIARELAFVTN